MRGCSLDIHRVFSKLDALEIDLGLANIILLKTGDEPIYQIIVQASFASYLGLAVTPHTNLRYG